MAEHSLEAEMAHSHNGYGTVSVEPSPASKQQSENVDLSAMNGDTIPPAISKMDFKKLTIRELLESLLQANALEALKEFRNRTRPTIRGTVAKALGQFNKDDLIEDLEQDTYVKLTANDYKALRDKIWPKDNSVFRFVQVTAINVVFDYQRNPGNRVFFNPAELNPDRGTHDQTSTVKVMLAEIDKCLETCAHEKDFARDRAIFYFFHRWGYTAREIAEMPSINLSTKKVENILQKMMSRLRAKLRKPGKGATPD